MSKSKVYKLKGQENYLIQKKGIVYTECDINGKPILKRRKWDDTAKELQQSYIVSDSSRLAEVSKAPYVCDFWLLADETEDNRKCYCETQKPKQLEIFN